MDSRGNAGANSPCVCLGCQYSEFSNLLTILFRILALFHNERLYKCVGGEKRGLGWAKWHKVAVCKGIGETGPGFCGHCVGCANFLGMGQAGGFGVYSNFISRYSIEKFN